MDLSIQNNKKDYIVEPKTFALWIALGSITMMFVALTSAYIVRQSAGNWLEFAIPGIFIFSTLLILVSSITLEISYRSYKAANERRYKSYLILTTILGIAFVIAQFIGWNDLVAMGIELTGNPSGSFFYVISGLHAVHILGGIAVLVVALIHAFSLPFYRSDKRKLRFQLVTHYWHYVGVLWIYLFLFLTFFR